MLTDSTVAAVDGWSWCCQSAANVTSTSSEASQSSLPRTTVWLRPPLASEVSKPALGYAFIGSTMNGVLPQGESAGYGMTSWYPSRSIDDTVRLDSSESVIGRSAVNPRSVRL